jgi:outer membrane immunogenic protein
MQRGWTAGVGAEKGFAPNWSARWVFYVDLANSNFVVQARQAVISSG